MIYDGNNKLHQEQARARIENLIKSGRVFEITEKRPRTLYLHYAIRYLALQLGELPEYCKQYYYKKMANGHLFFAEKQDKITGNCEIVIGINEG